jgi:hypothetical protein
VFGRKPNLIRAERDRVARHLTTLTVGSEDYVTCLKALNDLNEMDTKSKLDKDVLASVATNLAGILMIIRHERVNVIASKAMSILIKPRPL